LGEPPNINCQCSHFIQGKNASGLIGTKTSAGPAATVPPGPSDKPANAVHPSPPCPLERRPPKFRPRNRSPRTPTRACRSAKGPRGKVSPCSPRMLGYITMAGGGGLRSDLALKNRNPPLKKNKLITVPNILLWGAPPCLAPRRPSRLFFCFRSGQKRLVPMAVPPPKPPLSRTALPRHPTQPDRGETSAGRSFQGVEPRTLAKVGGSP